MGGVTYTGGCIVSNLDGGSANGGFTLRLPAGTHHLDGKEALALARTRENLCAPNETDIQREEHQQALFTDMKGQLLSPSSFLRLPWIAWHAPPAIISDMSGTELLGMFAALAVTGTPPTHVLKPTGQITLPDGEEGLTVSEGAARRRRAVHGGVAQRTSTPTTFARYRARGAGSARYRSDVSSWPRPARASPARSSSRSSTCSRREPLSSEEEPPPRRPPLTDSAEELESAEEELSADAAFSRWRLRVP